MIQHELESQLASRFPDSTILVENESYMHSVPKGSETHFKVVVVSEEFEGKSLLARHRLVNETLSNQIARIRAMAVHAFTPSEFARRESSELASPNCMGGSKIR